MVITSHQLLDEDGTDEVSDKVSNEDYMKELAGDKREIMRLVTQETRANLIQDIIGHPEESVSLAEFNYMNPSKKEPTIREHLDKLKAAKVVRKRELPPTLRSRDLPYSFYELSAAGRAFLEDHEILIDDKEEIKEQYSKVKKNSEIQSIEDAPRP